MKKRQDVAQYHDKKGCGKYPGRTAVVLLGEVDIMFCLAALFLKVTLYLLLVVEIKIGFLHVTKIQKNYQENNKRQVKYKKS